MSQLKVNSISDSAGANGNAITLASDGTCTAKVTNNLSNRNLIINGAMQVAQRSTSTINQGYCVVDRFGLSNNDLDEGTTNSQHALTSSDTGPWAAGFRNSFHIQNGNQTGGAGADDRVSMYYKPEAQDLANSGWDYTSASSYITLSFWVKSSVAQNFYFYFRTDDGSQYNYVMETGSLSANTWTKVTKTIPGNSNLTINDDNGVGALLEFTLFRGTNKTGTRALNTWEAYNSSIRVPDMTSTWYTTNDATWEITGVQLEVGDVATDFEHRSYQDEFLKCARYHQEQQGHSDFFMQAGKGQGTTSVDVGHALVVPLRAEPTVTLNASRVFRHDGYSDSTTTPTITSWDANHSVHSSIIGLNIGGHSSLTNNEAITWCPKSALLTFDAEL